MAVDLMYGFDELEEALSEGDFVVLALPVTPKTHHLMNAERLARLQPDAYLINVGRGVLIDEDALVRCAAGEELCAVRRSMSLVRSRCRRSLRYGRWRMF